MNDTLSSVYSVNDDMEHRTGYGAGGNYFPKITFRRQIEAAIKNKTKVKHRISKGFAQSLQTIVEKEVAQMFDKMEKIAKQNNRSTIMERDVDIFCD